MPTPVTEMLGIDFPILAFSHCGDVVAAVTNAGGMGVLGATALTPEQLEIELDWIEEEVHGRPYGVDLLFPASYVGPGEGEIDVGWLWELIPDEHRAFLDDLLERYDLPEAPEGAGRGMGGSPSRTNAWDAWPTSPSPIPSVWSPMHSALRPRR